MDNKSTDNGQKHNGKSNTVNFYYKTSKSKKSKRINKRAIALTLFIFAVVIVFLIIFLNR